MLSKPKRILSVALLVTFITASAFALKSEPIERKAQNTVVWTRISEDGNDWIQGNGGSGSCQSAELLCQLLLPPDYDPNDHPYDDNVETGSPVGGGQNGFKPQ